MLSQTLSKENPPAGHKNLGVLVAEAKATCVFWARLLTRNAHYVMLHTPPDYILLLSSINCT